MEQRHTWLAKKTRTCERRPKDGGAAAAPSYVLHNNSSKGKKMLRDKSLLEQGKKEEYGGILIVKCRKMYEREKSLLL